MKKIIFLLILILFLPYSQAELPSNLECIEKYRKVSFQLRMAGGGMVGVGGAVILPSVFLFPPLVGLGVGIMSIGLGVLQPISKSYERSYEALQAAHWALFQVEDARGSGIKELKEWLFPPGFKKLFKKKDQENFKLFEETLKRLFSEKSKKKWCTHPLYDYLTFKRKIQKKKI
jgi:hypothetical protein